MTILAKDLSRASGSGVTRPTQQIIQRRAPHVGAVLRPNVRRLDNEYQLDAQTQ